MPVEGAVETEAMAGVVAINGAVGEHLACGAYQGWHSLKTSRQLVPLAVAVAVDTKTITLVRMVLQAAG
jgi:hypothetical protein